MEDVMPASPFLTPAIFKYSDYLDKVVYGTGGDDNLYGAYGNDRLYGFDGNDNLYGGDGADRLYGGFGEDSLYGDSGNDSLSGEEGHDFLNGGLGNDTLYGGTGNDTLWGDNGAQTGSDTLFGQDGNDFLFGGASADYLDGGNGDDTLWGDAGSDYLVAGNGWDDIWGGSGADTILETGDGNDFIRLYQGDSFAFTGHVDTIITGSDWLADPYTYGAGIVVSGDVVGAGSPTAYTDATTIEDAAAEAAWQIANWYAERSDDPVFQNAPPQTHAIYLYNASQDQGYLAIDMDIDGSFETGVIFPGLSIEKYYAIYSLVPDSLF
jgi:hypothetical protein